MMNNANTQNTDNSPSLRFPEKLKGIGAWLREYHLIRRYLWHWIFALIFLLCAAGATLAVPMAFRGLIDTGLTNSAINQKFLNLIVIALVLAFSTAGRFYLMSWLGERIVADMRRQVYENLLKQSPTYFETLQVGEVLSRLTSDTVLVQTLVGTSISIALRSIVMFCGGVVMMLATSAWLAGLMVLLLVTTVLPLWALGRRVRRASKASQESIADTSAMASETLNAIPTVQAFVREKYEDQRYQGAVEAAFVIAKKRILIRSLLTIAAIVMAFGIIIFVLWIGARQVASGAISVGELTQFLLYAILIAGSIGSLSEVWGDVQRAAGATERLVELMQTPSKTSFTSNKSESAVGIPVPQSPIAIEFNDLIFSYPSRPGIHALDHFSIKVPAGSRYAIVGPSGAGKTTILNLLLRFYLPASGKILVNGINVEDWNIDRLRTSIGIVSQEPVMFAASAMENIRYGKLEASDEEVIAAAKAAYADEFITRLPEGYQSFLGERGTRLSSGQKQRISIARAILKNPPILLLDEATSALDAQSEREVQKALDVLLPGRTSLIIAHRLATILRADKILVLDQGHIIEEGTHEQLLKNEGLYSRLAHLQFNLPAEV